MFNLELVINNISVDYEDIDSLPFETTIQIDNFFAIGQSVGTHLDNLANSLLLPATPKNQKALKTHLPPNNHPFKAVKNGITLFNGTCITTNRVVKDGHLHKIGIDLKEITYVLFAELKKTYLNQLNLGTQLWIDAEITGSWAGDVSTYKGVFAPILYGTLSEYGDGYEYYNSYQVDDFRFSVYFYHIIKQTFIDRGYTLESDIVETNWFKHIAFLAYGKRPKSIDRISDRAILSNPNVDSSSDPFKKVDFNNSTGSTPDWDGSTHTFTALEYSGIYVFDSTLTGNYDEITVERNGNVVFSNPGNLTFDNIQIYLDKGDTITVHAEFSEIETDPSFVPAISGNLNIILKDDAYEYSTFKVAENLPRIACSILLKAVTELVNGVWKVNHLRKIVYFESRFSSLGNDGWYKRTSKTLKLSSSTTFNKNTKAVQDLILTYGQGKDGISKYLKEENSDELPLLAAKVELLDRNTKTFKNSLFEPLMMARSLKVYTHILPSMLGNDYKKGDILPAPTFEEMYKCGLIIPNGTSIRFKGTFTQAPLLSQIHAIDGVNLSYCDTSHGIGLVNTFFKQYFYLLKYSEVGKVKALLYHNQAAKEDFRNLIEYQNQKYILLKINKYNLTRLKSCDIELIKYSEVKAGSLNVTHNAFEEVVYIN